MQHRCHVNSSIVRADDIITPKPDSTAQHSWALPLPAIALTAGSNALSWRDAISGTTTANRGCAFTQKVFLKKIAIFSTQLFVI